ncbi:hypothetical protein HQN86_05280 [Pedobacter panaciterrae]|jgi:hypothetical protein|uniref:hypothetical protein n=1 Tax=Pedobacter panaciterrae TaxID=363849 RepID=UPI00155DD4B0|nr:hypothetical protein [Pedobacter panaciterrae]NQX53018.1 hypothetical protein [Pedobacter panaciterrae]
MDPFNIIINTDKEEIELNIHPEEAGTYKIVYHGALIGEIFLGSDGEKWKALTADELQPGGFPVYEYDETSGHQDILLDEEMVQEIGRKIAR